MTTDSRNNLRHEVERIRRVSDMLTSIHSILRDEYSRKATVLDCALFGSSIILAALVFVDPLLLGWLPLSATGSRILLGAFALITFFLSLVIFRIDWKSKAELHKRAAEAYANIKLETEELLTTFDIISDTEIQKLLVRYRDLGQICVAVPEANFLRLKRKHRMKVAISKYLDDNPEASICLFRMKSWLASNFGRSRSSLKRYTESDSEIEDET